MIRCDEIVVRWIIPPIISLKTEYVKIPSHFFKVFPHSSIFSPSFSLHPVLNPLSLASQPSPFEEAIHSKKLNMFVETAPFTSMPKMTKMI